VSDILARQLSQKLNRHVSILNFSRDSTGVLAYIDIAAAKIPQLKPDVVLMLVNVTGLIYERQWRKVLPDGAGGRQLYILMTPDANPNDEGLAFPQSQLINDAVTEEWCSRMKVAKVNSNDDILKNDPIIKKILSQQNRRLREVSLPIIETSIFLRIDLSFILNLLEFNDPFHKLDKFKVKSTFPPFSGNKYSKDPRFIEQILQIKASGIPLLPIHLPTLPEMRYANPDKFAYAEHGVSAEQGDSLSVDLQDTLGQKWVHLFRLYPPKIKSNPDVLVKASNDSHPSPLGMSAMADALENVLTTHPSTANLFKSTNSK
jgi:hypothetical protein